MLFISKCSTTSVYKLLEVNRFSVGLFSCFLKLSIIYINKLTKKKKKTNKTTNTLANYITFPIASNVFFKFTS